MARGAPPGRPKGIKKTGGRQVGTPNKATADARKTLALLLEANLPKLQSWINRVARKDPATAFKMVMDATDFVLPKLARIEHTGADGRALPPPVFAVTFPAGAPGLPAPGGEVFDQDEGDDAGTAGSAPH